MRFEYADPLCGECMDLEKDRSGKICGCDCHSEKNPYTRYHTTKHSLSYILYAKQSGRVIVGIMVKEYP